MAAEIISLLECVKDQVDNKLENHCRHSGAGIEEDKMKDVEKLEELMGLNLLDYQKKYLKEILKTDKNEPLVFIPRRKVGSFIMVIPQALKK